MVVWLVSIAERSLKQTWLGFYSKHKKLFFLGEICWVKLAGVSPQPKPALYNMADKKKDDEFGSAWDRDPNRMNTHLQEDSQYSPYHVTSLSPGDVGWPDRRARRCSECRLCVELLQVLLPGERDASSWSPCTPRAPYPAATPCSRCSMPPSLHSALDWTLHAWHSCTYGHMDLASALLRSTLLSSGEILLHII